MRAELYRRREQAYVKHFVLRKYLLALAMKIGQFRSGTTLNYIDGFSGPWDAQDVEGEDCSPVLAMKLLEEARASLAGSGKSLRPRCMFIEKSSDAYQRLVAHCKASKGTIEVNPRHGEFEGLIGEARSFAGYGPNPFAFVFIDPTGWTGFGLNAIAPLLCVKPSEVLINFMLKDVHRFIDHMESTARPTFEDLFGQSAEEYRKAWHDLEGLDREDAIVRRYCERIQEAGAFDYCASTIILNPVADRTHYHLVYATRSLHGLLAFRETERSAMREQHSLRFKAKARRHEERTGQYSLFEPDDSGRSHVDELRERYHALSQQAVVDRLSAAGHLSYEEVVGIALAFPLTSETDLKRWISAWQKERRVSLEGLAPRARVPKIKKNHAVRWHG